MNVGWFTHTHDEDDALREAARNLTEGTVAKERVIEFSRTVERIVGSGSRVWIVKALDASETTDILLGDETGYHYFECRQRSGLDDRLEWRYRGFAEERAQRLSVEGGLRNSHHAWLRIR